MAGQRRIITTVLAAIGIVTVFTALSSPAAAADTTPPRPVTALTATSPAPDSVTLHWTNPTNNDFALVRVCRAVGSIAPTLPCAGVNLIKPTSSFTDRTQLLPNTRYTYSLWAVDKAGNVSAGKHAGVTTQAKTPPGNVTALIATALADGSIRLDWTNPADPDFAGVRVCRATGATAPTLPCAGVNLAAPIHTFTDSTGLIAGTQYTYTVFAYDTVGTTASGAHATATAAATPPGSVTNLSATALSATSITLTWTNPGDADFAGVRICRAFGTVAPTLPCAGVNLTAPTSTFTDSTGLVPSTQYSYSVFAYDTAGNAAAGASTTVSTPPLPLSANVTGLTASAGSPTSITLDWTNPDDPNFAGVLICDAVGPTAPTMPCGGVTLAKPAHTYTNTFQVFPGTQYTYAVFALNASGAAASGTTVTVTTPLS